MDFGGNTGGGRACFTCESQSPPLTMSLTICPPFPSPSHEPQSSHEGLAWVFATLTLPDTRLHPPLDPHSNQSTCLPCACWEESGTACDSRRIGEALGWNHLNTPSPCPNGSNDAYWPCFSNKLRHRMSRQISSKSCFFQAAMQLLLLQSR